MSFFEKFADHFSQYGFMPHGHCYLWKPWLVSVHVVSDFLIGLAYVAISLTLYGLVKRTHIGFNRIVLCFGVFIAACGCTHFMEIWNLWNADYWWSAWVKVVTAVASVFTGIYLFNLRHTIVKVADAARQAEEQRLKLETLLSEITEDFNGIANSIPQLAWKTDPTGYITWYNQRWYDYTGTSLSEMQGWGWQKVHHPDHVDRVTEKFKTSIARGENWEDTFPLKSKSGQWRWFLSRAIVTRDAKGNVLHWFGTNTDVTEELETRRALNEALKVRDEFLSIASHELKTPLTALKLEGQMQEHLAVKRNDEGSRKVFGKVVKLVGRLDRLVEDMLDISRIQTGKLTLRKEDVNLPGIIRELIERTPMEGQLTYSGPDELRANVDVLRFEQVLTNLYQNARKYAPGSPVETLLEDLGERIEIRVVDHGPGIAPEAQKKIFDRFERAVEASEVSGLGLGLYISQEIISAHGGSIALESTPGRGAIFIIRLPKT